MKRLLLSLLITTISSITFAQLSGTYTIDSGSPTSGNNFQSFSAAFSALTSQGVNGAVIINVAEGTYSEQVFLSFQSIAGASATNTITIQSDASNTSNPVWTWSSYPIYWNYCNFDYITFDGIDIATSGTSYMAWINYGSMDEVNFENCTFSGGSYQFYIRYQSGGAMAWENCNFEDFRFGGIYQFISYFPYMTLNINNNTFMDEGTGSYPYAIYLRNSGPGTTVSNNYIELNGLSGGYGMYLGYLYGNTTTPCEIYNNIINFVDPNDPFSQYGIYSLYGNSINFHHNTIRTTNSYQFTRAAFMYATSTSQDYEFKNNIVVTPSTSSYGFYGYTQGIEFDNNVWYQGGNNGQMYMWVGGTTYNSFSDWQSNVGGSGSVYADPSFVSSTNLTPQSVDANDIGTPLGITTDIFGLPRSATEPDPGAIEFSVPTNNATIDELIAPDAPLCADDTAVIAVLKNTGLVPLTSCTVTYELNGNVQSNFAFSGSLAVGADTTLTLVGSTTFSSGDEIRVWSSMPNGVQDSSALNDTVDIQIFQGLSGTYSVPNDYATLAAATDDIMQKGLCDHVVIDISPGVYTETIALGQILGSGPDATLTFKSSTNDSADVFIESNSGTTGLNYVVFLDGTDYVNFHDLSIRNTSTSFTGTAVRLENGAENNMFDACLIQAGSSTTTSNNVTAVWSNGSNHNLTLTNNRIKNGGYGLYIYGNSSDYVENIIVENNVISDQYYMFNYLYYIDHLEFNNNRVENNNSIYLFSYGLRMYYVDNFNVTGNYIGADGQYFSSNYGFAYPVYMFQCIGSNNPRSMFANNCINAATPGQTSYGYYGVYMSNCGFIDFDNNTVNRLGGSSGFYYTAYIVNGGLISLRNNSFADYANGFALRVNGGFAVSESDHNNFYTNGNNFLYFQNSQLSSVEEWYDETGYDMNSISTDPAFEDSLACITCNDTLDAAGEYVGNMYDIDSNMRSMTTPDIGAVEWVNPTTFTLGGDSTYCADEVVVEAGPAQNVTWSVNGNSFTTPNITLTGGSEATTYNVLVSIQTQYCGDANDNALITLVPNASLDSNTHLCADESAVLNPGGLASGSYTWSSGQSTQSITVDEPGVYTVTKDVMGCESMASTVVTQSQAVEIIGTDVCSDDLPLSLDATISNGTTYAWSGGSAPGAAVNTFNDGGPYSITATDAFGCTSVDSFEIVVLEEPEAIISTPSYSGNIYVFDASSSNYFTANSTVSWNFGVGATPQTSTNVMETVVYPWSNPASPASYSVSLEINNGCGVDIATEVGYS